MVSPYNLSVIQPRIRCVFDRDGQFHPDILKDNLARHRETIRATAGTFLNVPKHVAHRFENKSAEIARMLILFAPAGLEHYFAAASGRPNSDLPALAKQYGIEFVSRS